MIKLFTLLITSFILCGCTDNRQHSSEKITTDDVQGFVLNYIAEYDKWSKDILRPYYYEAEGNEINNEITPLGLERRKLVNEEFSKRIGIMFIGPVFPNSYSGVSTENGFVSGFHGVRGETIKSIVETNKDEWVVETTYKYETVGPPSFKHYRYYVVNVGGRLRFGRIMIIDENQPSGYYLYQHL